MKNLLPKILWDYVVGVIVGVILTVVSLVILVFVLQASFRLGTAYGMLRNGLATIGWLTLLGTLFVVTLYEVVMLLRARGKMAEPGTTESRVLSREVIVRALVSGAVGGVYTGLIAVIFVLLAREASELNLIWVLILGLFAAFMLVAAGALAYAYVGSAVQEHQGDLNRQERTTLLALPLVLAVTLGFLFGAAAEGTEGVVNALVAALLIYVLARGLEMLRWRVLRRSLEGLLSARGGPTIEVVSTHRT